MQPIYNQSPNQFSSIYSMFSDGIYYSYPYITYEPDLLTSNNKASIISEEE